MDDQGVLHPQQLQDRTNSTVKKFRWTQYTSKGLGDPIIDVEVKFAFFSSSLHEVHTNTIKWEYYNYVICTVAARVHAFPSSPHYNAIKFFHTLELHQAYAVLTLTDEACMAHWQKNVLYSTHNVIVS